MAFFPFTSEAGFETGAADSGHVLTDTTSKARYMHYTETVPTYGFTPWRGAYCLVIDQATGTTTTEAFTTVAGFDHADNTYWAMGFALYVDNTTMANGNRTSLVKIVSASGVEVCLQLYYLTTTGLHLLLTEADDTAVGTNPYVSLVEGKWHWIEMYGFKDNAANNNGTAYLIMDGEACGSLASLDQADFTDAIFGVDEIDAGHTAGVIAFDDILCAGNHTAAIQVGTRSRYSLNPHVGAVSTATCYQTLFLGPGTISGAELLTAAAGDILRLYDTDTGNTTGTYGTLVAETACLDVDASAIPITGPITFERGCLSALTAVGATGARALIHIDPNPSNGLPAPVYYGNDANLKYYAIHRTRRGGNR